MHLRLDKPFTWGQTYPRNLPSVFCFQCQGIGRRFSHVVCKKADIDVQRRAGEMTEEEVTYLSTFLLIQKTKT